MADITMLPTAGDKPWDVPLNQAITNINVELENAIATIPAAPTGGEVPNGGTTGQVLTKDSGTDQDTSWQSPDTSGEAPVNTVGASGSTETLSAAYQLHKVTMDANCTFTFTSPSAGAVFAVLLSGAFVPTWPGSVDWPDGTVPTYTTPALYVFATFDGGTTWQGVQSGKAFA
jgi:hypothetical protein